MLTIHKEELPSLLRLTGSRVDSRYPVRIANIKHGAICARGVWQNMAGHDGNAPSSSGSESDVMLLYEYPSGSPAWIHTKSPALQRRVCYFTLRDHKRTSYLISRGRQYRRNLLVGENAQNNHEPTPAPMAASASSYVVNAANGSRGR